VYKLFNEKHCVIRKCENWKFVFKIKLKFDNVKKVGFEFEIKFIFSKLNSESKRSTFIVENERVKKSKFNGKFLFKITWSKYKRILEESRIS